MTNPAYPNGQCSACGQGLTEAGACQNVECDQSPKFHLLVVWGDVEPHLGAPVATYDEVVARAAEVRKESDKNGVYWIRLDEDGLSVGSFSSHEVDPNFID